MSHPTAVLAVVAIACAAVLAEEPPPDRDEGALVLEARPVATSTQDVPVAIPDEDARDYEIGRQDLLEIRVFGLEDFDQTVRVSNDGTIRLPLLGRLEVAGWTKEDVETRIARLLEERFVRDPQVSIFVREFESKKVAVTGAVKSPGSYAMLGTKTLLEMISAAGGLDRDYGEEIVVFRRAAGGETRRIPIPLERLVYRADPDLNIVLAPGDIVYVPVIEKIRIFVGGAVQNPNLYEIPRNEPVTVLKAITLAGGTTERAAEKKIQILRTDADGRRVTFLVDLRKIKRGKAEDPILEEDDVVFVQEAFF